MKAITVSLCLLACFLAGCASPPPAESAPPGMYGTWSSKDTTARYRISEQDGRLAVDAWSSVTGEEYEVTDVRIVDGALHAKFKLPSTGHVTRSVITLVGNNSLRESCTGDWTGTLVWTRDAGQPRQEYFGLD